MPELMTTNPEVTASAATTTYTVGYGPYYMHHLAVGEATEPNDTDYFAKVTHGIGFCDRTGHLCTGTCLNAVERAMLLKACVLMPNGVLGEYYNHPQFRILALPPWARSTFLHFWQHASIHIKTCLDTPGFDRGGEIVRLNAIYAAHHASFDHLYNTAKEAYTNENPVEADAWDRLFVQAASRETRETDDSTRTPVRSAQITLAVDLQRLSNNVNARIFDEAGSLYFVFCNAVDQYPPGLNSAYSEETRDVMQTVATQAPVRTTDSYLFAWLSSTYVPRGTSDQDSSRLSEQSEQPADFRDESMDVDM